MAMAERATTPFPEVGRALAGAGGRDPAGALYLAILPRVGGLLADPGATASSGSPSGLGRGAALIDAGRRPSRTAAPIWRSCARRGPCDMAVHPRTERMRVLTALPDGTLVVRHRYETWVEYASRPLAPRVDLAPLVPRLQEIERQPGTWRFDGVEPIRPRLYLADARGRPLPSSLGAERLADLLAAFSDEERALSSGPDG